MRYSALGLLQTLTLGLALCPWPAFSDTLPGTAAIGASAEPAREIPSADNLHLDLHLYGFSYHTDRDGSRNSHVNNELNYGLGLNYEFQNDAQGVAFFQGGVYEDSGRNWAKLAGPGYQFKLGDNFRLGAGLMVIQSKTYNNGATFAAPIPLLTYVLGAVKINAIYIPRFQQMNNFAVFGLYFSIPLRM